MAKENAARAAMDEHGHSGLLKCQGLIFSISVTSLVGDGTSTYF
jgi:hypothetical protein